MTRGVPRIGRRLVGCLTPDRRVVLPSYYRERPVVPTTIKLSKDLKERIARLIEGSEQSMHAFLLDAIEQRTAEAERRREFVAAAVAAREEMSRTGKGFPAEKVHAYVRARAAGKKAVRPRARAWRR